MNIYRHRGPTPRILIPPGEAAERARGRQPSVAFNPCLGCGHTKHQQREIAKLQSEVRALKAKILTMGRARAEAQNYPDKIYVMGVPGEEFVKIGISYDVEKRRESLAKPASRSDQHLSGLRIFFQHEIGYSARKFEKFCHNHFRNLRAEGEWFRVSPEVAIETINRLLLDWKDD